MYQHLINRRIVGVGTADDYQVDKLSIGGNYFSDVIE